MESDISLRKSFDILSPDFPKGRLFWADTSFQKAANRHPLIKNVAAYFPPDLSTKIYDGQAEIESLWSSYKDHGYGFFFYALAKVLKFDICIEIGVLHGFTLLTIAAALRDNCKGIIHGFDLFERYPYRHEEFDKMTSRIKEYGLEDWATASVEDAFQVHELFNKEVDYLHVDISNSGDTYRKIFTQWAGKVRKIILLEGGSLSRDKVDWMIKYKKTPIRNVIKELKKNYPEWDIFVFDPYPSLTVALRKNEAGIDC